MADTKGKVKPAGVLAARVLQATEELPPTGVLQDAWVTVRYQGDALNVALTVQTAYGRKDRTATATVAIEPRAEGMKELRAALDGVIERHFEAAQAAGQRAAAQAYSVAVDRGEE